MKFFAIKQSGFTLIELLVAISIVSIVFAVVISSVASLQKSSRDTQRKSDIRAFQSSLQQYYADQHFFPITYSFSSPAPLTNCVGNPATPCPAPVKSYQTAVRSDPSTNRRFCYKAFKDQTLTDSSCDNTSSATNCNYYLICAQLENSQNNEEGNNPDNIAKCNSACTPNTPSYNFAITPN